MALDRLVGALNVPVYRLLGLVYDPWAPDTVAALALLAYYVALVSPRARCSHGSTRL